MSAGFPKQARAKMAAGAGEVAALLVSFVEFFDEMGAGDGRNLGTYNFVCNKSPDMASFMREVIVERRVGR